MTTTHSKQISNGYCTHYARTNFIICAHEVNGSIGGQCKRIFFLTRHRLHTHVYVQFFLALICASSCDNEWFFFVIVLRMYVWANTCRETINTTQRPKSYKLFFFPIFTALYSHPERHEREGKNICTKLNFPCIFPHTTIFTWKWAYRKKNTNGFLCEKLCVLGNRKNVFNFVQRTQFCATIRSLWTTELSIKLSRRRKQFYNVLRNLYACLIARRRVFISTSFTSPQYSKIEREKNWIDRLLKTILFFGSVSR